jgi:hypothetical protein
MAENQFVFVSVVQSQSCIRALLQKKGEPVTGRDQKIQNDPEATYLLFATGTGKRIVSSNYGFLSR